jgi:hypothetical protein
MAASNEWTEYHLTQNGWVEGSQKRDFGQTIRRPSPEGSVMRVLYHETCNGYGPVHGSTKEEWRSDDTILVEALLENLDQRHVNFKFAIRYARVSEDIDGSCFSLS